jgi:PAS domain S-box-containing protein
MSRKTNEEKCLSVKQLRLAAEARLANDGKTLPDLAVDQLRHEYEVSTIELEMQNEALRQAQIDLAKSRDMYLDLYDFSPVGYLTISSKGMVVEANLTAARLLGRDRARILGSPFFCYVAADYKERWYLFLRHLEQPGRQDVQEMRFERSDGSKFFARLDGLSVCRDDEAPSIRISFVDIGDMSSKERSVRESEGRYRTLYESMRDAFAIVDMSGNLVLSNQPYQEMLGYTENELRGKTYIDLTPDKWHSVQQAIVEQQVMTTGESVVYEKEYIRKDGTVFPVELKTVLLKDSNGQPEGMWAMVRDITGRKRAEADLIERESRFCMAMQAISGVVYDWNMTSNAVFFSERLAQLLGACYAEGVPVREWWKSRVHPDDYALYVAEIHLAMKTTTGRYEAAYRVRHRDGHWLHVSDRGFVVCDAEGIPVRMIGSISDISARIRAETALRALNDSLEEQVVERSSELQAGMAQLHDSEHFIRTTLDTISAAVAVVDEDERIIFTNRVWENLMESRFGSAKPEGEEGVACYYPWHSCGKENAGQCGVHKKINGAVKAMLQGKRQGFFLEYNCPLMKDARWFAIRMDRFTGTTSMRVVISHEDITERKLAAEELSRVASNFKKMLRKVELSHEEQSKELAREVHDQLGATLTMLKLGLSTSKSVAEFPSSLQDKFDGMIDLADMALQSVKRVSAKLRPSMLDTLGLVAAVKWHGKEFSRMTGIATEIQMPDYIRLSSERGNAVFRIIQESLTNIAKHAHASKVNILGLRSKQGLVFMVNDDGVGLREDALSQRNSFGVIGMKERASHLGGKLSLDSLPDGGTSMTLYIPLEVKALEQKEDLFS